MAFLRVVSHIPAINATGVYLNGDLSITFDKAIIPSTVDYSTFSVNHHATFVSVPGSYSIGYDTNGNAMTAVFTPSVRLTSNSEYDVYVYGNPDSILSQNNKPIDETYSFTFTTGVNIYDDAAGSGVLPSGTVPGWTGVLTDIPPSVTGSIESFYVYSTTPKHQTPNIVTTTDEIKVVFTGLIQTPLSEMSGYITLEETPVLQ